MVADRSPSMSLFPHWLPWLDKQAAVREVGRMIVASGAVTNALIGFAAVDGGRARIVPARRDRAQWRAIEQQFVSGPADGPPDSLDRALELLSRTARTVPPGTLVFLLSDFLPPPGPARLTDALAAGWDVIPVVVQDPVWERSFPDVSGVTLPLLDPDDRTYSLVRLGRKEARARRELNERRAAGLDRMLRELQLDPVAVTSSDRRAVHAAFLAWAEGRRRRVARPAVSEAGRRRWAAAVAAAPAAPPARNRADRGRVDRSGTRRLPRRPADLHRAPLDRPITVKRALSSSAALFGDPVGAEIDVYTSDASVPAPVGPCRRRASGRTGSRRPGSTREHEGGISLLRTRITLECLTRTCLPPRGGVRVVRFRPFAVTYRRGGQESRVLVPWDALQVSSRLPRGGAAGVGIVDTAPALEPGFDRSPETVRALLLVVASVLGLAGAALVLTTLWPSSYAAQRRLGRLSPLERSLLRVEAAARDDEATRRRTLDDLATRLGGVPAPALERRTRALAWGQAPPEPEALVLLAAHVRAALNGGVRA